METSLRGLVAIVRSEGVVPAPYIDPVGVWTFGIGHTAMSGEPNPETMPRGMPDDVDAAIVRAFDLFRLRIKKYEREVSAAISVPLQQHEFDALVSFHFNTGAIRKASATKSLNAGYREDAARRLTLYNKGRINGRLTVLPGLVNRRSEERDLFLTGVYPSGDVPVWKVQSNNKYRGVYKTLSGRDIEQLLAGVTPAQPPAQPVEGVSLASSPQKPATGLLAALMRLFGGKKGR